jgi:acyl-CoA thioester hydrolase
VNRWPVTIELPVQWGDQDAFGHVNNVVYLRWFESARIAYFERAGVLLSMPSVGPILARQIIDYRLPLKYPDAVRVSATVKAMGRTSFTMGLRMRSKSNERAIAAEGEAVMVLLDYNANKPIPLPADLRARIEALEATAPEVATPKTDA